MEIDRRTLGLNFQIEHDLPALSPAVLKEHAKKVEESMAKEWASWNDHGSFKPRLKRKANNVIGARLLHKWKIIDGKKEMKSLLCVRGSKDRQGNSVTTSASAAARWNQRLVVSFAAIHGSKISIADVSTGFLRGLTFEEIAKVTGALFREVFSIPREAV